MTQWKSGFFKNVDNLFYIISAENHNIEQIVYSPDTNLVPQNLANLNTALMPPTFVVHTGHSIFFNPVKSDPLLALIL